MKNFEAIPSISAEEEKTGLSPEDQAVMSRRNFLKTAGAVAGAAAFGVVSPEVMAAPERGRENITLNFELTPFQRESLVKSLERQAPGARAEFTLSGPRDFEGEKIVYVEVIILLKDGSEKRGKGVGFHGLTANEKMARQALEDAFGR